MEAVWYNFKNKFKNGGRVPSGGGWVEGVQGNVNQQPSQV